MRLFSRRKVVTGASTIAAALGLGGCVTAQTQPQTQTQTQTRSREINPAFRRTEVDYATREPRGTIIVDPSEHFLYFVEDGGRAVRYGVGVGSEGFSWAGVAKVHDKQEWPDWYPTPEILQRRREVIPHLTQLQSGVGMAGGPDNPLGARALYLWQGKKDTLYRIHGTNEPWTIGANVSSGCIRLTNEDIVDLYDRTPIGTKVAVLASVVG